MTSVVEVAFVVVAFVATSDVAVRFVMVADTAVKSVSTMVFVNLPKTEKSVVDVAFVVEL